MKSVTPDPRFVYNGSDGPLPSDVLVRKNRPVQKNRPPLFRTIFLIFFIIMLGVFAIKNIITVDRLADEIKRKHDDYSLIENKNKLLQADIDNKSNISRIKAIAVRELNMKESRNETVWLEIDANNLKALTINLTNEIHAEPKQ
jgi:cell division protein FtsB